MVGVMLTGELRVALVCGVLVYFNKSSLAAAVRTGRLDVRHAVCALTPTPPTVVFTDARRRCPIASQSVVRAATDLTCVGRYDRAEHVEQRCLFLSRWLLATADVRELLGHRELTAVCLLAVVDPFPPRSWSLAATLAVVDDARAFVPLDESFPTWLETFVTLAEDWVGPPLELAAAAYALGCR